MKRNGIFLILIILLGALLRLIWLDKIPHSVNGDQLFYLLSAKSIFLTGKDITQVTTPLDILLFNYHPGQMVQAELPFFLELLTLGPFSFSLFGAFLPNAILGILIIPLMYLITRKLVNEPVALLSSFIAAVNPWFIFIGRTAYEMIPATFFYLCAIYLLLIAKRWRILLALPFFILAFYAYIGTKIILFPIALVSTGYCYFFLHKKQFLKQYLTLIAGLTLFILFYAFQLTQAPGSRLSEILSPTSPQIAEYVDAVRKTSISSPFLPLFENKLTVFGILIVSNIFTALSPDYLFLHGDQFASLGKYGLFYPLDFVFLLIGGGWLFFHKKKLFYLLTSLSAIALIPQIIHHGKGHFTPHLTMLFPFFIIAIAAGAWQLAQYLKDKKLQIGIVLMSTMYLFSIGYFLHIYFFQIPLQHNFFNFSHRVLSKYITLSQQYNGNILVYTSIPDDKLRSHIFYSNVYNENDTTYLASSIIKPPHVVNNVTFLPCDKGLKKLNSSALVIVEAQCGMTFKNPNLTIADLSDSGATFRIYNDKTCGKYQLKPFISGITIDDFSLESTSEESFCKKFIITP